jgi:hypothetical protein
MQHCVFMYVRCEAGLRVEGRYQWRTLNRFFVRTFGFQECIDEEEDNDVNDDDDDVTTDDTTDFSGSNRHEDSGVGRTDDSTRNEESSEQELPDIDGAASLGSARAARRPVDVRYHRHHRERRELEDDEDRDVSAADDDDRRDVIYDEEGPSPVQCQQFYAMLKERCNAGLLMTKKGSAMPKMSGDATERRAPTSSPPPPVPPRATPSSPSGDARSPRRDVVINPEVGCCPVMGVSSSAAGVVSRRAVPRMGTRLETVTAVASGAVSRLSAPVPRRPESIQLSSFRPQNVDAVTEDISLQSPCRVRPRFVAGAADTDSSPSSANTIVDNRLPAVGPQKLAAGIDVVAAADMGTGRAEAYRQCGADVMVTNRANLRHTIALQQSLFQQQIADGGRRRTTPPPTALPSSSSSSSEKIDQLTGQLLMDSAVRHGSLQCFPVRPTDLRLPASMLSEAENTPTVLGNNIPTNNLSAAEINATAAAEAEVKMEWVVKRRSDGTRYVTRRPVKTPDSSGGKHSSRRQAKPTTVATSRDHRTKLRCRATAEQRWAAVAAISRREVACSTDDDDGSSVAVSEVKIGRYWTREQRRQHVEQRRERDAVRAQRRAEAAAAAAALQSTAVAVAETGDVALFPLTPAPRRYRNAVNPAEPIDSFTSVDEILARGSRGISGRYYYGRGVSHNQQQPLLSVTTV